MSASDSLSPQFKTLHHYGNFGSLSGAGKSLQRGLHPMREFPDYDVEDEGHPHHDSVWAFDDPTVGHTFNGKVTRPTKVTFQVPEHEAERVGDTATGAGIYRVRRRVEPSEITSVSHLRPRSR